MALLVAVGILMAGISPALLCYPDATLRRGTVFHDEQLNGTLVDSLTSYPNETDFFFKIYRDLAHKNRSANILFSPYSISAALDVLSLGAKGKTLREILESLKHIPTNTPEADIHQGFGHLQHMLCQPGDQVQICTGSAMFIEKRLQTQAEFKEKARAVYQTETFVADFLQPQETKKLINDYVRKQILGKVKETISDLDDRLSMVLVNYIYFKGKWMWPFDPLDTIVSEFQLDNRRSVKMLMMTLKYLSTPYFRDEELSCSVVELKFRGNAKAMFILPDLDKMQQVEANLQAETLNKWRRSLRPRRFDELYLPKFSISKDYKLEDILPELDIREVFSPQADLSRITGAKNLSHSEVLHNAVLEVAETSANGRASTVPKDTFLSPKLEPTYLAVDKPFIFLISSKDFQNIYLLGKLTHPNQG